MANSGHPSWIAFSRLTMVLGLMLGVTANGSAQTAADHAAQAHGRPIVNGKDIQPTPRVGADPTFVLRTAK